jgi:hypothetical protein
MSGKLSRCPHSVLPSVRTPRLASRGALPQTRSLPPADSMPTATPLKKIIVAVHGIGDQVRNETVLSTTVRFCEYFRYPGMVPLGAFYQPPHVAGQPPPPPAPPLIVSEPPSTAGLSGEIGFAEVYWADLARDLSEDGYTLQETKAWARSIVNRVRVLGTQRNPANANLDYRRIRLVLEEIIDTVAVLEALLFLAKKAGLFEFDLKKILDGFLGDVQLVTEFSPVRQEIVGRFHDQLAGLHAQHRDAEIHIVAHSEGTAVAFLGLLEACGDPLRHSWIERVRGFMTIGSPIDKHLILWPSLFANFRGPHHSLRTRIHWANYVDYCDPVGFNLDTARDWLREHGYNRVFAFGNAHDYSFRRYPLPGKAHVDYWGDAEVFGHFIRKIVDPKWPRTPEEKKQLLAGPPSKGWVPIVSYGVSYLVPFAIIHLGVYFLVKTVFAYLDPKDTAEHPDLWKIVLSLSWLIAGTTVWVRLVRLTRTRGWFLLGMLLYSTSVVGFWKMIGSLGANAVPAAGTPAPDFAWFDPLATIAGLPLGVGTFLLSLFVILLVLLVNLAIWRRR